MTRLIQRDVLWRLPQHAGEEHKRDLELVHTRADADGKILLTQVPSRMLASLCVTAGVSTGSLSADWLGSFRVPETALALQPAVDGDDPANLLSVHTHTLGDSGFGGKLAHSRSLDVHGTPLRFDLLTVVYIDDGHQLTYPSRREPATSKSLATRVGNTGRLAIALVSAEQGIEQNASKQKWTSADTTPSLGVEVEFVQHDPSWPMRCAVAPSKRRRDADRIRALLAADGAHVTDKLFNHVTGKFAWAIQPRRPFLSVLGSAYRERHSRDRPPGPLWLSPTIRQQLSLVADVYPFLESLSRPTSGTVLVFDASGVNKIGNGGYGVVSRSGATAELAAEILGSTLGGPLQGPCPPLEQWARPESNQRRRVGTLPTFKISDDGLAPTDTPAARAATDFLLQDWGRPDPDWAVEKAGEFRSDPGHINFAEAETGAMALRVGIAKHHAAGHRVLIGGDNTASLHAFHKGRSSSWRVNAVCRRIAAMCFAADVTVAWFWLPSKANAADHPSRLWMSQLRQWR
jgi:hypothetical protein